MHNKPQLELIDLQSAHVTQINEKGIKTDWIVRKNITNEDIHKLPKMFNEQQVFNVLDFARKYELIAFNAGIRFQKGKQNELFIAKIKELEILTESLSKHNDYLADALDKATNRGN